MENEKIKIAVIVSSLEVGGAEQMLSNLLHEIDAEIFDVHLLFVKRLGTIGLELERSNCAVTVIGRDDGYFRKFVELIKILKKEKIKIILFINHRDALTLGVAAAVVARVPAMINWHNETNKIYRYNWLFGKVRRCLYYFVDTVVAVAKMHKDYIHKNEGVPSRKIQIIHNSVSVSPAQDNDASQIKSLYRIPSNKRIIGMISVLRKDKGHPLLIEAAFMLREKGFNPHYVIVGEGPEKDAIQDMIIKDGLADSFTLLGLQRDLTPILSLIDIGVLPSFPMQETLSVAALEMMAAGIPMVATDVGSMSELIQSGCNGFLVTPYSSMDLADKLCKLLSDDILLKRLGGNAKKTVDDKFNIKNMANDFETLFVKTVESKAEEE